MAKEKAKPKKVTKKPAKAKAAPVEEKELKVLKPAHIRFVYLYLGGEGGETYNNATRSYMKAFDIPPMEETTVEEETGRIVSSKAFNVVMVRASQVLRNIKVQALIKKTLEEDGWTPEEIKRGIGRWARQEAHPAISLSALTTMAKMQGLLKEGSTRVEIPELERIGEELRRGFDTLKEKNK